MFALKFKLAKQSYLILIHLLNYFIFFGKFFLTENNNTAQYKREIEKRQQAQNRSNTNTYGIWHLEFNIVKRGILQNI